MENRGNRTSEELAETKAKLFGFPASSRHSRNSPEETVADPSIQIGLESGKDEFQPGDFLQCEYNVSLGDHHHVQAIETSVIWLTEGKGDTDIGVHFFERRPKEALTSETFDQPQRISTVLPASPLSYEGLILKIRWCVRVRLFMPEGEQVTQDHYFQLGQIKPFCQSDLENSDDQEQVESD